LSGSSAISTTTWPAISAAAAIPISRWKRSSTSMPNGSVKIRARAGSTSCSASTTSAAKPSAAANAMAAVRSSPGRLTSRNAIGASTAKT
jgi:hypothetical protein